MIVTSDTFNPGRKCPLVVDIKKTHWIFTHKASGAGSGAGCFDGKKEPLLRKHTADAVAITAIDRSSCADSASV